MDFRDPSLLWDYDVQSGEARKREISSLAVLRSCLPAAHGAPCLSILPSTLAPEWTEWTLPITEAITLVSLPWRAFP